MGLMSHIPHSPVSHHSHCIRSLLLEWIPELTFSGTGPTTESYTRWLQPQSTAGTQNAT